MWETDFYTPQVLGGAALLTIQHQRCIKFRVLRGGNFYTPLPLNCQKGQRLAALEVYKNQSPNMDWGLSWTYSLLDFTCVCIYIYAVELLSGPNLAF